MDRAGLMLGVVFLCGPSGLTGCGGPGPGDVLKNGGESLIISIGLSGMSVDQSQHVTGVRSVQLHVSQYLREPHGVGPDGQPISADGRITLAQAHRIIDLFDEQGVLATATRHHSTRRVDAAQRSPPPADSTPYSTVVGRSRPDPHVDFVMTVHDENWGTHYRGTLDLTPRTYELLRSVRSLVDGQAKEAMDALLVTVDAFESRFGSPLPG